MPPLRVDESLLRLEIRLSQRRVVVFQGKVPLKSYAIAVGRPGWETPTGVFNVRQMFKNPTWVHPLKPGILIPGGDPENPLGLYWIGFWTDGKNWIGFHGTDNPGSVGKAVSHGCIRMYNKDIEELFKKVSLGTEVKVVR
jgi:lipoprotein-anchoring transpeptidase ErfK/SrfK